jgi:NAD(P)-dependent dehydrogenase (short-subunit alcohol dehydrogenase family)
MKTVVITGSARGLGFEMAKNFRAHGFNVVLSDINEQNLANAKVQLEQLEGAGEVASIVCNVCDLNQVENLWAEAFAKFGTVDVWINNAGVNQPPKHAMRLILNGPVYSYPNNAICPFYLTEFPDRVYKKGYFYSSFVSPSKSGFAVGGVIGRSDNSSA